MFKILGGVVFGVFIGALAFEILSRRKPELLQEIRERAKRSVQATSDALDDRYGAPKRAG